VPARSPLYENEQIGMNSDETVTNRNRRRLRLSRAARAGSDADADPAAEEQSAPGALRPERLSVVEAYVDAYPADAAQRARAKEDLRDPARAPYPVEEAAG
jgi:hypothetical protein